jgi:hypothetical protein
LPRRSRVPHAADTRLVQNGPQQLQETETEFMHSRAPLVRDQRNVYIDKNEAANRRWLSGPQVGHPIPDLEPPRTTPAPPEAAPVPSLQTHLIFKPWDWLAMSSCRSLCMCSCIFLSDGCVDAQDASGSVAEREAQGGRARLSGVQNAVIRYGALACFGRRPSPLAATCPVVGQGRGMMVVQSGLGKYILVILCLQSPCAGNARV